MYCLQPVNKTPQFRLDMEMKAFQREFNFQGWAHTAIWVAIKPVGRNIIYFKQPFGISSTTLLTFNHSTKSITITAYILIIIM